MGIYVASQILSDHFQVRNIIIMHSYIYLHGNVRAKITDLETSDFRVNLLPLGLICNQGIL